MEEKGREKQAQPVGANKDLKYIQVRSVHNYIVLCQAKSYGSYMAICSIFVNFLTFSKLPLIMFQSHQGWIFLGPASS